MNWLEVLSRVVASPVFHAVLIVLGLALAVFLLCRLYLRLRTGHLHNVEYERTFSELGVYEGEEVELIETIRNRGLFRNRGQAVLDIFRLEIAVNFFRHTLC